MKSTLELGIVDYIYNKERHYEDYLKKCDDYDTSRFLRRDQFKSRDYNTKEAIRISTISSLASISSLNRFNQIRHESALLASERQTMQTIAKIADVESKISQSNVHLQSIDHTLTGIDDRITESNSILNDLYQNSTEQTGLLEGIDEKLHDLSTTFNWFSASVVTSLGTMGQSLQELIKLIQNPSKTWALEQFVDARDFYHKKLMQEAYDCIVKSLTGHGSHTGNPYDHRALFLKGLIHLGTIDRKENELIDLPQAKECFLAAARYSQHEFPKEAARAFCYASRASYCMGDFDEQLKHAKSAIELNPRYLQALISISKSYARKEIRDDAVSYLRRAVSFRPSLIYKIVIDEDFTANSSVAFDAIKAEFDLLWKKMLDLRKKAINSMLNLQSTSTCGIANDRFPCLQAVVEELSKPLNKDIDYAQLSRLYHLYIKINFRIEKFIPHFRDSISTKLAIFARKEIEGFRSQMLQIDVEFKHNKSYSKFDKECFRFSGATLDVNNYTVIKEIPRSILSRTSYVNVYRDAKDEIDEDKVYEITGPVSAVCYILWIVICTNKYGISGFFLSGILAGGIMLAIILFVLFLFFKAIVLINNYINHSIEFFRKIENDFHNLSLIDKNRLIELEKSWDYRSDRPYVYLWSNNYDLDRACAENLIDSLNESEFQKTCAFQYLFEQTRYMDNAKHSDTPNRVYRKVKSPDSGLFIARLSDSEPNLVGPGYAVKKGNILGIIHAKDNRLVVKSPLTGNICTICCEHGTFVSKDDTLFCIAPSNNESENEELVDNQNYTGSVLSVTAFGVFMEVISGVDGLIHKSELAEEPVNNTDDLFKVGDVVTAKYLGNDESGRVKMSRKAYLEDLRCKKEKYFLIVYDQRKTVL